MICIRETMDGTLEVVGYDMTPCPYTEIVTHADVPAYVSLFEFPTEAGLQQAFVAGFSLPLLCYLVAWGYGTCINWFNSRPDDAEELD